jgi:hypothetical protein
LPPTLVGGQAGQMVRALAQYVKKTFLMACGRSCAEAQRMIETGIAWAKARFNSPS